MYEISEINIRAMRDDGIDFALTNAVYICERESDFFLAISLNSVCAIREIDIKRRNGKIKAAGFIKE